MDTVGSMASPVHTPQPIPGFDPRPVVPAVPEASTPYHHFLRTPRHRWWKPLLSILALVVAYFVLGIVLTGVASAIDVATGAQTLDDLLAGRIRMTPVLLVATNLQLGLLIPASMLLQWGIHGQRPRWLSSVEGGFRWGWLARSAVVLVPVFALYVGGSLLLTGVPSGPINPGAIPYVVIILLTTPLQSAGEEYAVRGLMTRAIASWVPPRLVALVVASVGSALLFAVAHPNLTPARLGSLLAVALGFSLLTWRTGGLEAATLGHALNNVLVLVPTALWGDMDVIITGESAEAGWLDVAIPVIVMLVAWVGIELLFRRSRYRRCS